MFILMNTKHIKSPNAFSRDGYKPFLIVIHISDGDKQSVISEFSSFLTQKSSHYLVCKNGEVIQFVDENLGAWTNGDVKNPTSELVIKFLKENPSVNLNKVTLSIEHEGYGHTDINAIQYNTTIQLVKELCQKWNIQINRKYIIGQRKINSVTKTCPGLISIPRIIGEATRPPVSLTPAQKQSIIGLLIAFLADNAIIERIKNIFGASRTFGAARSPEWRVVRKQHITKFPFCALCGSTKILEVHHKKPFHLHPELELDPSNLITLCESGKNGIVCHRAFGHLGDYKSVNNDIDSDVKVWNEKLKLRP